ncbi:MAG TPA: TIGR03667 family PPOX class F420-dependent oxidoreductase [Acidimicrobiia bacterium]|jgi:PPOX class probable F420-dependent enzyme|nr:TIGR03667 family PPOX class F420-dependent oxidoreductase [Acidimicrobiia bacterium]
MFDDHARARQRLADELVAWMTTVRPDGRPQTSPVWFLVEGDEILVYSAETARLRNIAGNPHVAMNLDGNGRGGDIVTLEGTARIVPGERPASANATYVAKYEAAMERNEWSPDRFAELYPVAVRVTFERGRAW